MERHIDLIPTRSKASSRTSSLILAPALYSHREGAGNIQMGQLPPAAKSDEDEQPLADVVLLDGEPEYPTAWKLAVITIALCMAIFLVALDTTIVATAIPRITDHFKALDDVGWYGSAYLLTICGFQLAFGKCYSIFSIKSIFLSAIGIFELGSLVCGVAPTSTALIIGRAIAGLGCAGIFSGALIVIAYSVPLHRRPAYTGLIGAMYAIASIAGPLLGGVFTDQLTWRWCFYINLPIGAVTTVIIVLFFQAPKREKVARLSFRQKLNKLDIIGTLAFLPAVICLLVGLQWGGTKYAWSNARVIILLVLAALLAIVFIGIQIWKQENATVPPRIIKQRSMAFGTWYSFWLGGVYFLLIYYVSLPHSLVRLPVWFQAIKGVSATESGVMNLPLIMAHVISALIAGGLITVLGYYTPFMLISSILVSIGAGLLTTWKVNTGHAMWIGYQATFGLGSGLGMNQPLMAAQTVLALDDVSIGTASVIFSQTLGGAIFISAGQNIFTNDLLSSLHTTVPQLDPAVILATGATELRSIVQPDSIHAVIVAYNSALVHVFYLAVSLACLSIFGSLGMQWRSVKETKDGASALDSPQVETDGSFRESAGKA